MKTPMVGATLPLHEIAHALPAATHPARPLKRCVLLIEDNKDAMRWVQRSLKEYGNGKYKLEWRQSLSDGLSRLSARGIDLIVLDLGLPDCSSPFTGAWVRQAAPKVPIIVLTGDQSGETELSACTRGIYRYLVKGQVSRSGLVKAISDSLAADALIPDILSSHIEIPNLYRRVLQSRLPC
jgi:DNA-binding NtrC family response regulator